MNPYQVNTSDTNIRGPLVSLEILYENMPKTSGCEGCKAAYGEADEHWCCTSMNPSMYYAEFLLVWEHVQNHWGKRRKSELIVRAIKNYLDTGYVKGCIFYADGKCNCYKNRPLMCRMYGIIPQDNWDKRVKELEERGGEGFTKWWRPQCNLVKTETGNEVTPEEENRWFAQTRVAEQRIGVPGFFISAHDLPGGCYRTFHDHLLLEVLSIPAMNMLTKIKMEKPNQETIDSFTKILLEQLEKNGAI